MTKEEFIMSTTIKTGWLKDNDGDKFAPKTLSSQVITSEGHTLESVVQGKFDEINALIENGGIDPDHPHVVEDITDIGDYYYTKTEIDEAGFITKEEFDDHNHDGKYAAIDNVYTKEEIDTDFALKSELEHNHDEEYVGIGDVYTKAEMDSTFATKEDIKHNHDGVYVKIGDSYTKDEMDSNFALKTELEHNHDEVYAKIGDAYTKAEMDAALAAKVEQETFNAEIESLEGKIATDIETHNTATGAHADIRTEVAAKVAKADIVTDLATSDDTKVLAASQGAALKTELDTLTTGLGDGTVVVNTATKLDLDSDVGGLTQPIYFADGKPATTTYALDLAGENFGLVKSGGDVTIKDGVITVNDDSHAHITTDVDGLDETLASINKDIFDHKNNKNNPHNVNLEQLGVTATATELNTLDGITAITTELNVLNGITASTAELNYVKGVTSGIQDQIDSKASQESFNTHTGDTTSHITADERTKWNAKQSAITGAATTITGSNLTTNRALISNGSGKVAVSAVTSTELGYLDGVTSNIQNQFDSHTGNTTVHITSTERTNWNAAKTHANSAHAPSDAHMTTGTDSQNNTTMCLVAADVNGGANKTYVNDYVYIGSNNCLYSNSQKVSVEGHAHSNATTSAAGFMSTSDKSKLDGLSSSTYAGGTKVTLNGSDKGASTASFYAPTSYGSIGYILQGNGSGNAPTWTNSLTLGTDATTVAGYPNVAIGYNPTASGSYSTAIGYNPTASGNYSCAQGFQTTAGGEGAHAEGINTVARNGCGHAEGIGTCADGGQHSQGHYNTINVGSATGTSGTAFTIGNGTSEKKSNAFRISYGGFVYAQSSTLNTGADYAEYFEWQDSNPDAEDRRGYFVTLDGDKIKIAEPNDYILGIVSGQPAVIGNGDENWRGRYILDEFGAFITEEFEYEEEIHETVIDEETGEARVETKTVTKTGTKYKENPDYDSSLSYIQRADRPEWDAVGMMGVLSVRDDGTCQVNGYCKVAEGGTATASENGYRVIKRINDHIVQVVFR